MRSSWSLLGLVAVFVAACGPAAPPPAGDVGAGARTAAASKTLTLAVEKEPEFIIPGIGLTGTTRTPVNLRMALGQRLATYDERGALHPQLATELPSQAEGTWVVKPDGTMRTTYRLHDNVTWHDGVPLTSRDFAFALQVLTDRNLGTSTAGAARLISGIETTDDLTIIMEWSQTFPGANALVEEEVGPLPAHILAATFEDDRERFLQLPYFTTEFIGVGPYRLQEWELGSHMVLAAYDRFFRGRASIDTLIVRFIPNPPTAAANLLSGAVDGALPRTLDFAQALAVKEEWERAGKKPVFLAQPTHWRYLMVQLRPDVVTPRELLDARARRGLLHGIDRQTLVDALLSGQSSVSDTFVAQDDIRWEWVRNAVTRYPFDARQAQDLLAQVGWRRGADGNLVTAGGQRVIIQLRTSAGGQSEQEQAIVADNWKDLGVSVEQYVQTPAEDRDTRFRASAPAIAALAVPLKEELILQRFDGNECSTEENRWIGRNAGCWVSESMDRATHGLQNAIDPADRRGLYRELVQQWTQELPQLPLFFQVQVVLFREGVTGVRGDTRPSTSESWNILEWDIR